MRIVLMALILIAGCKSPAYKSIDEMNRISEMDSFQVSAECLKGNMLACDVGEAFLLEREGAYRE